MKKYSMCILLNYTAKSGEAVPQNTMFVLMPFTLSPVTAETLLIRIVFIVITILF